MDGAQIKVIGLGGAGNNAVNRMIESGLPDVEFIAANTDSQVLESSQADIRIQLGENLTRGLGAGANPEIGEKAALENQDFLAEQLAGADLVFITAGMGGGTGTGSAPVIADIARQVGALSVAVVTRPFSFEGPKRRRVAEEGIRRLRDRVDAMVVVNNERLRAAVEKKVSLKDAFLIADRILYHGVRGITDVINMPGMINVDFADVKTMLTGAGQVLMGIGAGRGEGRVHDVVQSAISSPLLDQTIEGAGQLLLNVVGADDLSLMEASEVVEQITRATGLGSDEVDVLYGVTYDNRAADELRVIMIAAGFTEPIGAPTRTVGFNYGAGSSLSLEEENFEIPAFIRYGDRDIPPRRRN